jgi:hypothetical protein
MVLTAMIIDNNMSKIRRLRQRQKKGHEHTKNQPQAPQAASL